MEVFEEHLRASGLQEPFGILGFGVEGKSSFEFLKAFAKEPLHVFERNGLDAFAGGETASSPNTGFHTVVDAVFHSGPDYLKQLHHVKTLFCSPGIRRDLPELQAFQKAGGRITSQTELFFDWVPTSQIIGVTGTLGKGTCCAWLQHIFQLAGLPHVLLGNIGTPFLSGLADIQPETRVIAELSSFQLASLKKSPHVAVVLKTTQEHLDWHLSVEEYWESKSSISKYQNPQDVCIFHLDSPGGQFIGEQGNGKKISFGRQGTVKVSQSSNDPFERLLVYDKMDNKVDDKVEMRTSQLKIKGAFQLENAAAVVGVCRELEIARDVILKGLLSFKGLEHRLEFAGANEKWSFYNDSYATRPEATLGAVESFSHEPLGLILGGSDKKVDLKPLATTLAGKPNLKAIALIGETAGALEGLLVRENYPGELIRANDLREAVGGLCRAVTRGVILLSPACASFGLFKNYVHRGLTFKNIVKELI